MVRITGTSRGKMAAAIIVGNAIGAALHFGGCFDRFPEESSYSDSRTCVVEN